MNVHTAFPKHPALQGLVRSFMLVGIHQENFANYEQSLTSAYNGIIISLPLYGSYSLTDSASGENTVFRATAVQGPMSRYVTGGVLPSTSECGWLGALNILFSSTGIHPFLHKPIGYLHELRDMCVDADQHLRDIELLREQLQEILSQELRKALVQNELHQKSSAPAWIPHSAMDRLVAIAERFLVRSLGISASHGITSATARSTAQAEYICRRLTATHGKLSIDALAGELGLTTRQILNIMNSVVGVSAKIFAERERFMYASQLLQKAVTMAPTQEAQRDTAPENAHKILSKHIHTAIYRAGYYDQSHCIRDFQRFAGITPLEFVRPQYTAFKKFTTAHSYDEEGNEGAVPKA